jgi:hypothetical protein
MFLAAFHLPIPVSGLLQPLIAISEPGPISPSSFDCVLPVEQEKVGMQQGAMDAFVDCRR